VGQKSGFHHTEATKKKLSNLRRGDKNPFFGRVHTDEFKARLSQRTKAQNAARQYEIQARSIRDLTDAEAAYLAGMVDGDGSIGRQTGRKPPVVAVCNTNRALMDWLDSLVPYKAYCRRVTINATALVQPREPVWVWTVYGARDVAYLIQEMRPYLIIKKGRGEEVLAALLQKYGTRLYV
jgi:hypothetical protein